jgi:RIO kinase 1
LWIIDVSQSVEHDHPKALEFLRADISHIESYFAKRGGVRNVLGLRKVFDWIIAEPRERAKRGGGNVGIDQVHEEDQGNEEAYEGELKIVQTGGTGPFAQLEVRERERGESEEELMADLKEIMERSKGPKAAAPSAPPASNGLDHSADAQASLASQRDEQVQAQAQQQSSDEAVFFSSYIPRTLNEVYDPERDIQKLKKDGAGSLIYAGGVTGLGSANEEQASRPSEQAAASSSQTPAKGDSPQSGASDDETSDENGSSDEDDENGETREKKGPRGHRHEDREAKKQRKQEVKSANQERRKTKMSKKEKLKKMKKK